MAQVHHLGVRPTVQTPPGGAPVCSSVCKFQESSGRTFFDAAVNSICLQRACLSMMVLLLVVVGLIFWARILLCHSSATRSGHSLEVSSSSCACLLPSAPCSLSTPTATLSTWMGGPPLWTMQVAQGTVEWSSLCWEDRERVEDFDYRKAQTSLSDLEARKSPVYRGTHVEASSH